MRGARSGAAPSSPRPRLQGPGVLRRRYTRPAPPREGPPPVEGSAEPSTGTGADSGAPDTRVPAPQSFWTSSRMIIGFIALQIGCQLALLVEAISPVRVVVRILAFGLSLALLVLLPGRSMRHPAMPFLLASTAVTALNFFHPQTNTILASATQLGIQISILAPLFWVTRLRIDGTTFRRTLALLFLFNATSAAVGVLQVYFPGSFQPAVSTHVENYGELFASGLQFETASGARIFRPFGLTDVPGGAATGAFYAVLLGAGFLISARRGLVKLLSIGGIFVGVVSLYLCQIRATAMMLGVCLVAMVATLVLSGRLLQLTKLLAVVGGLAVMGIGWAATVGGDAVVARWDSLFEKDFGDVYYSNRGFFLEGAFKYYLPDYPIGAGLGRYGMANAYFGNSSDPSRPPLWTEIQWSAWILDGGVLVLMLYPLALLATALWAFRLALSRKENGEFWLWGSIIFAYDIGAIALTFSYPFFMSQAGLEFWLLNAALFGAFAQTTRQEVAPRTA